MEVQLLPLVPDVPMPRLAGAALRSTVPKGYGVQEQCLPFTAATSLGLLVPCPFSFGLCAAHEVPRGATAFTAPAPAHDPADPRVFYVVDRPESRFTGNAFRFDELVFADPQGTRQTYSPVEPGLSFFDRADQAGLFKLHLPWVVRTPAQVDALFGPPIHRPVPFEVKLGLVETDWYAHPVNLVVVKPAQGSLHVKAGDVVAQVHFVPRSLRKPDVRTLATASPAAAQLRNELLRWYVAHRSDRSAYRKLARGRSANDDNEA